LLQDDATVPVHDDSPAGGATTSGGGVGVGGCEARYQAAVVEVYARFSVSDTPHSRYLVRHDAELRVTELVLAELRVADPSLAALTDDSRAVQGLRPGQTQVQVRTANSSDAAALRRDRPTRCYLVFRRRFIVLPSQTPSLRSDTIRDAI